MNVRKKVIIITSIILVALLIELGVQIIQGYVIYNQNSQMVTNERTTDDILIDWLTKDKEFDVDAFKAQYQTEEIVIESSLDGHKIPATYIYAPGNSDKTGNTIIMVHGLLGNRISNYPVAQMFLSQGYNVITYDQRSSGGNHALYTTFGYLESQDTIDYVTYATQNMASDSYLGAWGQSMGAATVENAMDDEMFKEVVDFVVLDCPMGNMEDVLGLYATIPMTIADCVFQMKLGFSFEDQSVIPQIKNTEIPVLIACSMADEAFSIASVERIYNAIHSEKKEMFVVNDSKHSDIYFDHPEEYQRICEEFLAKYVSTN